MTRPFLTARWKDLVFLNYACPRHVLEPRVPAGTELDAWGGHHLLSLVGFRFLDTRVRGLAIPGHRHFEEVNLRFYVRRRTPGGEVRRAVVFIRELVPRRAVAAVARLLYGEPYRAVPMSHRVDLDPERGGSAAYSWIWRGTEHRIGARVHGPPTPLEPQTEAEFVTEHYWGYTSRRDGSTLEYRVDHPPWRVWDASEAEYEGPGMPELYGPALSRILLGEPRSAFVAEGSEVAVHSGIRLEG